ncbi:MAG: hypothetical protein K2I66_02730, partial [Bacteroidales bacterium]|nr:hypothetical protein [Bacteroidales bacterium]
MKNAKLFWRLSGWFLMAALFLGFGSGTLRAQAQYERVTDMSNLEAGTYVFVSNVKSSGYHLVVMTGFNDNFSQPKYKSALVRETEGTSAADKESLFRDVETFAGITPMEVEIAKEGEYYTFKTTLHASWGDYDGYICWNGTGTTYGRNNGKNLSVDEYSPYYWTISSDGKIYPKDETTFSLQGICEELSDSYFFYCSGFNSASGTVTLYKKKGATPPPADPYVRTDETEVSYKIHPTENLNTDLSFTAGNLEDGLTISVASATDGQDAVITVDPDEISKDDASSFTLTLTTSNLPVGEYSDIITIMSGETKMLEVTVNLSVKEEDVYQLVTDAASLKTGDEVLIVGMYANVNYAMTASMAGYDSYHEAVTVTVADNAITNPDIATTANEKLACVFTLEKNAEGKYAFHDLVNQNYLAIEQSGTPSSPTASYFTVTIDATKTSINNGSFEIRLNMRASFRGVAPSTSTSMYPYVKLYKKQVPEVPTC